MIKNSISIKGLLTGVFLLTMLVHGHAGDGKAVRIEIPRFTSKIRIDGHLDESAWKSATKIQDFYTFFPVDGQPATEKTAVLLGYDATSLFVAFICFDSSPQKIRASLSQRDKIQDDDHIVIFLDTFNSGTETYQFGFNPYGIQLDGVYIDMIAQDFTPDYIFYSKGRRFKGGYLVEVAIPFKSIRYPDAGDLIWGISVVRSVKHRNEEFIWPEISRNSTTFVPQFAKLHGLRDIVSTANIEILPEISSTQSGAYDYTNRTFDQEPVEFEGGINLKYGISSNLVIDLALNPDFSQVEADADKIDINRRFPLFYDEKRPFFLEGTTIFQTPINAVYTRRIVDPVAGLKITGKTSGFEYGLLSGVDEYYGSDIYLSDIALTGPFYDPAFDDSAFIQKYSDEYSYHNVFRLKKSLWDYSHLGVIMTDKRFKDTYNTVYGIDGTILIAGEYSLTFQALNAHTKEFFDSREKSDPAFYATLYRGSRTFNFQLYYNDVYPNFRLENGFLNRTDDYREGGAQFWYDLRSNESFLALIQPTVFISGMYNHDGDRIEQYIVPSISFETDNSLYLSARYFRLFEEYAGFTFDQNYYRLNFSSKTLPWLFVDVQTDFGDGIFYESVYRGIDPFLGEVRSLSFGVELKPVSNWSVQMGAKNYLFEGRANDTDYRINQDIYRLKTNYQYSPEIAFRFIVEHNNLYQDIDLNALVSYQPSPGTVIFLGYNDYRERNYFRKFRLESRGLFMKLSYLFRI